MLFDIGAHCLLGFRLGPANTGFHSLNSSLSSKVSASSLLVECSSSEFFSGSEIVSKRCCETDDVTVNLKAPDQDTFEPRNSAG